MLQAVGLTKKYGNHTALNALDLEVEPGEIFCMLGANGAGKTTTINLFLDFIQPTAGEARIDGKVVAKAAAETKRVTSFIPERVALYGSLTGLENLAYVTELAGKHLSRDEMLAHLDGVGLERVAVEMRVSTYSKGMCQKVAVAIATAREAKVMLLDEPTSGLDPKAASELFTLLADLKDKGTTILMTTHDIFRAREIGTRVGIMKDGRLKAQLEPAQISSAKLETIYMEHMHD